MKESWWKIAVVAALVIAVGLVVLGKNPDPGTGGQSVSASEALPRLLNLGAAQCTPCKMMVPVREELTQEYEGKLIVDYIDVHKDRDAMKKYGISGIPTLIFYDDTGTELSRRTGFTAKEEILETFAEHGIALD